MMRWADCVEKRKYKCKLCNKLFQHKKHLNRHELSHTYFVKCYICGQKFRRKDFLNRHLKNVHSICVNSRTFQCNHCPLEFDTYEDLYNHVVSTHPLNKSVNNQSTSTSGTQPHDEKRKSPLPGEYRKSPLPGEYRKSPLLGKNRKSPLRGENRKSSITNALNNSAEIATIEPQGSEENDLLGFLANTQLLIQEYLLSRVSQQPFKWYLTVQIELERFNADGDNTVSTPHFRSRTYILLNVNTYNEHDLNEALQKTLKSLEEFMRNGSGWVLKKVLHFEIHTVKYTPLKASSYIPLPKT